ncbi:hypothetical protein ACIRPQ_29325 [Streptomyces sp. NPDC101213]|uniref:hypothetical protein n=1 Tax=Streptomyces sp. NPDC101213 TaxID=3366130 RepID=UPI0037F27870
MLIAVLSTRWEVSAASYAEDNGVDDANVLFDLGSLLASSINDLPAMDEAEGWASLLDTPREGQEFHGVDGIVRLRMDWRIKVDRDAWLAARGLDPRAAARPDLLAHVAWDLYHLGAVCETDAVMRAEYQGGKGPVVREFRPQMRRRVSNAYQWTEDETPDETAGPDDGPLPGWAVPEPGSGRRAAPRGPGGEARRAERARRRAGRAHRAAMDAAGQMRFGGTEGRWAL